MTVIAPEAPPKPTTREGQKGDSIFVKFNDGQMHEIPHPLIEVGHNEKKIQSTDKIKVSLWDFENTLSFEQCLEIYFGTNYNNYFRVLKANPEMSQLEVLKQLHSEVIEQRGEKAIALDTKLRDKEKGHHKFFSSKEIYGLFKRVGFYKIKIRLFSGKSEYVIIGQKV